MQAEFYNWMLVFLRLGSFLFVLRFFSMVNFPVTLRVALSALGAMLIAPLLPPFPIDKLDFLCVFGVMIQEISVGLLLGFIANMIFYAAELAGTFISTEMGLNMAAIFNPMDQQSSQIAGTALVFLATVIMLTLNLHHWMLLAFAQSYTVLPIGEAHISSAVFETVVAQTSQIFMIALQISSPVIAVSFVITLIFSVLSRATPEMNVFSEMFGFRIVGGLIVFGFTLQLSAQYVVNGLNRLPEQLLSFGQMLGGK